MKTRSTFAKCRRRLAGVAGAVGRTAAQARDHVSIGLALPGISIGLASPRRIRTRAALLLGAGTMRRPACTRRLRLYPAGLWRRAGV